MDQERDAANRDLLFGLLALQNGLVDPSALVAAFREGGRARTSRGRSPRCW